jgi:hypothetical protein
MRTAMSGAWVQWSHSAGAPVYATDSVAERIAELHTLLGEGPAAHAIEYGRPVTAPDITSAACRRAWPVFAGPAQAIGVRTVVAVPMQVSGLRIALFGLYSRYPITLSADQTAEVEGFAEIALGQLLDHRLPPADVDRWLAKEAEVHQATGIVSVQLGVGVDESQLRLRARAFAEGRPLSEIAHEVVTRRLRFSPDDSKQPP